MRTIALCALGLTLAGGAAAQGRRDEREPAAGASRAPLAAPRPAARWYPRVPLGPSGRPARAERLEEPVLRPPPRGTLPPRPGNENAWRYSRGGRPLAPERAQVVVQGRVLPDPPIAPPAGARLDAKLAGGGELVSPPASRDGRPLTERPLADRNGRVLAPGPQFTALIGRPEIAGAVADLQSHWLDRRNHGYSWRRWGGVDVAHHYDERGYHWWGFYAGGYYFWTRWHDGRYWWFDPYWRRWCFLYGGWWWWPSPSGAVYLYDGSDYENCLVADGGVLMTPDPTPPATPPPAPAEEPYGAPPPEPPTEPSSESPRFVDQSADGSRSVEIVGDHGTAYLYDLPVAASSGAASTGRWLADGVKGSRFVYEDKRPFAGASAPVKQIELTYDGSADYAVVDPAGERKVLVSGDEREALLYNLRDPHVPPVLLARGATDVSLVIAREGGRSRLKLVIVSADDEERGATAGLFTPDGAPVSGAPKRP